MISVALVGCAHIHTPKFVTMLLEREDVRVKSVWDHDGARAAKNAALLGMLAAPDLLSIWTDDEVQAVIICSETSMHHDLVTAAVGSGKDLFVEKPLAIDGGEAQELAAAIDAAGVIFSTGFFMRGTPAYRFIRDEIAAGSFGTITRIDVSISHPGALEGWFDDEWRWLTDPSLAGYGALGDLGGHGVDLILWLLGYVADPRRVSAWTGTVSGRYGGIDEFGRAQLEFPDGMIASVWASWAELANPVQLLVAGTDAQATVIDGRLAYRRSGDTGDMDVTLPPPLPHAFELFLDAVTGKAATEVVGATQAARCSAIIEAAYQAVEDEGWVALASR